MMEQKRFAGMNVGAELIRQGSLQAGKALSTHYRVECVRADEVIWTDEFDNLVVTAGLNDSLDKHFKGSGYTAAWYVGLTDGTPTFAAGDAQAGHAGWVEVTDYDEATREALVLGSVAAGSVDNSASKAEFTMNASVTVGGAFLSTTSTIGGSVDTLYGGGAFTAGDRSVVNDDLLRVTVTLTAAAA